MKCAFFIVSLIFFAETCVGQVDDNKDWMIGEFKGGLWLPTNPQNTYGNQSIFGISVGLPFKKNTVYAVGEYIGFFTGPMRNFQNPNDPQQFEDKRIIGFQYMLAYGRLVYIKKAINIEPTIGIGIGGFMNSSLIINPNVNVDYVLPKNNTLRLKLSYYIVDHGVDTNHDINFTGNYFSIAVAFTFRTLIRD